MSRSPLSICGAVWTCQHDLISVEVTKPNLPMVRASVAIGRVAVARQDDFSTQRLRPCNCVVDVVHLEPKQQAVSRRQVIRVADGSVVMFQFPAVQLQYELAGVDEAFVIWAAMIALAVEQPLIPMAARFDISHANQWLWSHDVTPPKNTARQTVCSSGSRRNSLDSTVSP